MIEFLVLTPAEWRVWRELRLAALADAPYAFGSTLADWRDADEERWRGRLTIAGSYNIVAVRGGEPAGMASGVPADRPDITELISMWVAPSARGHGIGDRLITEIARWAGDRPSTTLRLSVMPDNPAAIALYRRNGFVPAGESDGLLLMTRTLRARRR